MKETETITLFKGAIYAFCIVHSPIFDTYLFSILFSARAYKLTCSSMTSQFVYNLLHPVLCSICSKKNKKFVANRSDFIILQHYHKNSVFNCYFLPVAQKLQLIKLPKWKNKKNDIYRKDYFLCCRRKSLSHETMQK